MTGAYEAWGPVDWPSEPFGTAALAQTTLMPLPAAPVHAMHGWNAPSPALNAYELWPAGYIRRPRVRLIRRGWPLYGFGAEVEAPAPSPPAAPTELPAAAKEVPPIGKGLFLGAAYGIAIGMIASEFVMRKADAGAQFKQNHQLIMYGALFGGALGAFTGVQT